MNGSRILVRFEVRISCLGYRIFRPALTPVVDISVSFALPLQSPPPASCLTSFHLLSVFPLPLLSLHPFTSRFSRTFH